MVQVYSGNSVVYTSVSGILWLGDCEVSVHLQYANCTDGKDEEIPYQAGDGYIIGEHIYKMNLKGLHPLDEGIRSPQGVWVVAEIPACPETYFSANSSRPDPVTPVLLRYSLP